MCVLINATKRDHLPIRNVNTEVKESRNYNDFFGTINGYATDEWDKITLIPFSHYLANALCEELYKARKSKEIKWLRPDCKS